MYQRARLTGGLSKSTRRRIADTWTKSFGAAWKRRSTDYWRPGRTNAARRSPRTHESIKQECIQVRDGFAVFRREFVKWVEAHNRPSKRQPLGYQAIASELFETLQARMPEELLRSIGFALQDGWIATAEDGRGYFVRETQSDSPPQPSVYHAGGGKVIPWWEPRGFQLDSAHQSQSRPMHGSAGRR